MRGVDLSIFDFDYDLQWHALMLTPTGEVLGRFGGRDADTPAKYQTLPGLRHSLEAALVRFKSHKSADMPKHKPMRPEDYPAAERLHDNACIHCHHVNEFRRDLLQRQGKWSLDEVWSYPQPTNLGLIMDVDRGNRILGVEPKSPAALAGIRAKDTLLRIGTRPIASIADLQFALHKAPKKGEVALAWNSDDMESNGVVKLVEGWRKTDVSWRWSLKSLAPNPSLIGDDVSLDDRKTLGLKPGQLAYRQMNFLTPAARHAGLQANDIIVGINDQAMTMSARQFEMHIRLNYRVGQEVTLNVLRGKARLKLKLKLPE